MTRFVGSMTMYGFCAAAEQRGQQRTATERPADDNVGQGENQAETICPSSLSQPLLH